MRTLRQTRLRFVSGQQDKCYEVDLCELANKNDARYIVNFRYGKTGTSLREGTKTPEPVTFEQAVKIFDSVVVAKTNKGYLDENSATGTPTLANEPNINAKDVKDLSKARETILRYLDNPPKHWSLSRIVWRAGELAMTEAGDKILDLLAESTAKKIKIKQSSGFVLQYSCLWALARCGKVSHISRIEKLTHNANPALHRLGLSVCMVLGSDTERQSIAEALLSELPEGLANKIRHDDFEALLQSLQVYSEPKEARRYYAPSVPEKNVDILIAVYQLSAVYPVCQRAINSMITDGTLGTAHFAILKHLFKFSQLHRDTERFARLIPLLEKLRPDWEHDYSQSTLNYYRRRSWRVMKRLGEAGDSTYLDFAQSLLLSVNDEQAQTPRTVKNYQYDWDTYQNVLVSERLYGRFPKFLALNHVLYRHSEQFQLTPNRLAWFINSETEDTHRAEAFPELWDSAPERLLTLLLKARCEEVHVFASKALSDNQAFCDQLGESRLDVLETLLASDYDCTAQFALTIAQRAFERAQSLAHQVALIKACLPAKYEPAQHQASKWLEENPDCLTVDFSLLAYVIFYSENRPALNDVMAQQRLNEADQELVLAHVIDFIKTRDDVAEVCIQHVMEQLKTLCSQALATLSLNEIDTLLSHSETHPQLLGALLLVENQTSIADIPPSLLLKINQSQSESVQAVAISLLNKHSDAELLEKYDALLGFVLSEKATMRQAVHPIITRLAEDKTFAERMLNDIVPAVFRTEPIEGFHDDLLHLAETALAKALPKMDAKLRWRLLHAQSKSAKKLGAMAIHEVAPETYSVKQWALLGNNEGKNVREWVWSVYQNHVARIKEHADEGLRLLNSKWDDSRSFAIDYFRTQFNEYDWNPDLIVHLCDNTRDDVQRFGRDLLTQYFQEGDGLIYLIRLSQHPSQNVQLFTTNFLADYASDNPERLQVLKPYFITVLSQVYKGRIAKDRVIKFLNTESLKSEQVAQLVGDIYTRQSVTMAVKDKADYIEGMHALNRAFPDVALPIRVKPLAIKTKARITGEGV